MTSPDRSGRDTRLAVDAGLLPALFTGGDVAMVAVDADGRMTALTATAERLLGYPEAELVGVALHERLHYQHSDGQPLPRRDCPILAALGAARPAFGDGDVLVRKDGTLLVVSWAFAPMVLARTATGGVVAFHEVSDQRDPLSAEQQRLAAAEAANVRLALLADVTHALASASSVAGGLAALARLVVPRIADWVVLDLLDAESGQLERAALAHRDSRLEAAGRARLGTLPAPAGNDTGALAVALRGGRLQHLTEFPPVEAAASPLEAARLGLFHELGAAEAVTAPLSVRGRVLGAVTLVRVDPRRPYQPADLTFIGELATRAAGAVDTASLLERTLRRAEDLQRSLLPELPGRLGDLELAGTYRPASDTAHVGGDWYDAFGLPDASTALVVGDVAGHDLAAAARMGAVRHKLRALAADRVAPESEILGRLNRVLHQFASADLTTAIYARVAPTAACTWRLTWGNAGHLPPLLLAPGAAPRLLAAAADPPLGVTDLPYTDHQIPLPAGATVLLYTDGVVERPGESLTDGLRRLQRAAAGLDRIPLAALNRTLLDRVTPSGGDDVAVLAARLPATPRIG